MLPFVERASAEQVVLVVAGLVWPVPVPLAEEQVVQAAVWVACLPVEQQALVAAPAGYRHQIQQMVLATASENS